MMDIKLQRPADLTVTRTHHIQKLDVKWCA